MKYLVFDQSAIDTLIRSNDLTSIIRFLNDENYSLDIDYIFGQKKQRGHCICWNRVQQESRRFRLNEI